MKYRRRAVQFDVEIARTPDDAERLRPAWDRLRWGREEAELDYLLARVQARPGAAPFAAIVTREGEPVAGAVGRLEQRRLDTTIGYRRIYAPRARVLQIADGGVAYDDPAALQKLRDALAAELYRVDALALPALPTASDAFRTFAGLGGPLERQRGIVPWTRRRLVLPESFDGFLASLSRKLRFGIRYDAKKLEEAFASGARIEILHTADDHERLVDEFDRIARSTYQRAVGAGFADTPEQRELARIGLERGWLRGYLLSDGDRPVAYWLCATYGRTLTLRTTGFDPAYAKQRPGIFLLMRAIEDACADPELDVIDFGPGDASYKRQFSNESVEERNLLVFAPTVRGRRINLTRSAILGGARLARRAVDSAGLTDRVRSRWRGRLRR